MYSEVIKSQKHIQTLQNRKLVMDKYPNIAGQIEEGSENLGGNQFSRAVRHWHCISNYVVVSLGWVAYEFELMRMEYQCCIPLRDACKGTSV